MAFVTDSNHLQPLWQPPPTACSTAPGAASEVPSLLMQPRAGPLEKTDGGPCPEAVGVQRQCCCYRLMASAPCLMLLAGPILFTLREDPREAHDCAPPGRQSHCARPHVGGQEEAVDNTVAAHTPQAVSRRQGAAGTGGIGSLLPPLNMSPL